MQEEYTECRLEGSRGGRGLQGCKGRWEGWNGFRGRREEGGGGVRCSANVPTHTLAAAGRSDSECASTCHRSARPAAAPCSGAARGPREQEKERKKGGRDRECVGEGVAGATECRLRGRRPGVFAQIHGRSGVRIGRNESGPEYERRGMRRGWRSGRRRRCRHGPPGFESRRSRGPSLNSVHYAYWPRPHLCAAITHTRRGPACAPPLRTLTEAPLVCRRCAYWHYIHWQRPRL